MLLVSMKLLLIKGRTAPIPPKIPDRGNREGGPMEAAPPEAVIKETLPDPVLSSVAGNCLMENGQTNLPFLGTECDGSFCPN